MSPIVSNARPSGSGVERGAGSANGTGLPNGVKREASDRFERRAVSPTETPKLVNVRAGESVCVQTAQKGSP
jgi:hypothetical protein